MNKIRLFTGWFGILMPAYIAGILTEYSLTSGVEMKVILIGVIIGAINFYIGRKILKSTGGRT